MQNKLAERQSLLQTLTAFAHESIFKFDFDACLLQLDHLGEDVHRPIEQGACKHGTFDAPVFGGKRRRRHLKQRDLP